MRYIDIDAWPRKNQYHEFAAYAFPCYNYGTRIDVTELVKSCRESGASFFACFLHTLIGVCLRYQGFRLRMDEEKRVIEYDTPAPSYTVLQDSGVYGICITPWQADRAAFCAAVAADIAALKKNGPDEADFGSGRTDLFYISCTPWVDGQVCLDPLPLGDAAGMSIPRISWGKYTEENGRFRMYLSFTLNHALIDGYELCRAINELQKELDGFTL